MDLIERQIRAEPVDGLAELAVERGQRVILDLVLLRGRRPARGVGVAPLRWNNDLVRLDSATLQPRREKIFRPTVRTCRVEVADSRIKRGIKNFVGVRF